jgi:2-oxoglutarate ferredoxin oxidoreductase subunit beta
MKNSPRLPKCVNLLSKPSSFCPGCGHSIALKNLGFVIDELKIAEKTVFATDIGCSLLAWNYFDVNTVQGHHGRVNPLATGLKRGNPKSVVISYMGDGGGYAIGLHHLIHAAKRNEPITVILVNNTLFGMTGGQSAPTTLVGEITETTPDGKFVEGPFWGPELISKVADKNAYIARTSVDNLSQLKNTIKKAVLNQIENNAFSFVEILSYCPTNWKTNARETFDFMDQIKKSYELGEMGDA